LISGWSIWFKFVFSDQTSVLNKIKYTHTLYPKKYAHIQPNTSLIDLKFTTEESRFRLSTE